MKKICKEIDVQIKDEEKAVREYGELKLEFMDYPYAILNSIQTDEKKHINLLKEIKAQYCQ